MYYLAVLQTWKSFHPDKSNSPAVNQKKEAFFFFKFIYSIKEKNHRFNCVLTDKLTLMIIISHRFGHGRKLTQSHTDGGVSN